MSQVTATVSIHALAGVPLVVPGDDLATILADALAASDLQLMACDIIVVAQKIVSKAEGRIVDLRTVTPSARAHALAEQTAKDPRLVELVLAESTEVIRARTGVLIVAHRLGFVLANAGIDQSNVRQDGDNELVLLLPENPDRSATDLRDAMRARTGLDIAVLVIDSIGRAWRNGTVGTAIGLSGLPGLLDLRGRPDLFGRELQTSELGFADEVAAAASLLMGQADEGIPFVVVRGLTYPDSRATAASLLRKPGMDLFR